MNIAFNIIKYLARPICSLILNNKLCKDIFDNLVRAIMRCGLDRLLSETTICKSIEFCRYPLLIPDDEKEFTSRVLKNKPPVKRPVVESNNENFTFVVVSDVHVDPYYDETSEAECTLGFCCRSKKSLGEPINKTAKVKSKAGKWGTVAKCDIPLVF